MSSRKPPAGHGTRLDEDVDPAELEEAITAAENFPPGGPKSQPKSRDLNKANLIRLVHAARDEVERQKAATRELAAERTELTAAQQKLAQQLTRLTEKEAASEIRLHTEEADVLERVNAQLAHLTTLVDGVKELRRTRDAILDEQAASALAVLEEYRTEEQANVSRDAADARAAARAFAAEVRAAAEAEADTIRETAEAHERTRREEHVRRQADLDARDARLKRQLSQLLSREQALELIRRDVQAELTEEHRAATDDLTRRLSRTQRESGQLRDEIEQVRADLAEARARLAAPGQQSVEELHGQIERLRSELAASAAELQRRPPAAAAVELEGFRARAVAAERQVDELEGECAQLRTSAHSRAALEHTVSDLEAEREQLQDAIARANRRLSEYRQELDVYSDAADAEPADLDLVALDRESEVREADGRQWRSSAGGLKELALAAQTHMSRVGGRDYALPDVRLFLGGLAASQLHILEGISGTGKTSLPLAFAKAVGAHCEIVEVQASWRDRLDLVGTFNAFERRYSPTRFARALYRASTAGYRDQVTFIVLDEMNLAPPEYYFADILSSMESGTDQIEVLPRAVGKAAALDACQYIRFGSNVWFIGTANRDETTATIADKTYDRAHIMELPPRHPRVVTNDPPGEPATGPLNRAVLEDLFAAAKREHAKNAAAVREVTEDEELLNAARALRIGFGNRLDKMIESLVPVVMASGGTRTEALDHVLSTKLVRRLESRYEADGERFNALGEALEGATGAELGELPRTAAELERQRERLRL